MKQAIQRFFADEERASTILVTSATGVVVVGLIIAVFAIAFMR